MFFLFSQSKAKRTGKKKTDGSVRPAATAAAAVAATTTTVASLCTSLRSQGVRATAYGSALEVWRRTSRGAPRRRPCRPVSTHSIRDPVNGWQLSDGLGPTLSIVLCAMPLTVSAKNHNNNNSTSNNNNDNNNKSGNDKNRCRGQRARPLVSLSLLLLSAAGCLCNPDAKRLYDDLLSNYNRLIRPVSNNTDTVMVKLGLRLSQLIELVRIRVIVLLIFNFF